MLKRFVSLAALAALTACSARTPAPADISVVSSQSFAETEADLRKALAARDLTLFTVVDHGAGAKSVGSDIGASKLFIFGNPKSGTPLMVAEPKLGLELPMKILLHEADGAVHLHRMDVVATVSAYGVTDQGERLTKISTTLDKILSEAAK